MVSVFDRLEHEWRRLVQDRGASGRLADVRALAGGAGSLSEVEAFVRRAAAPEADAVLVALVRHAVAGDELAARTLLQLLLPGTRALARRWWALGDTDDRDAAAVAAVYHRIRSYPIERRPGRVAANVLMDAARELRRCVSGLVLVPAGEAAEVAVSPDPWTPLHPAIELVEVLGDAARAGIIDPDDAALIARSRIGGERVEDIAARRGLRPRTLWDRRRRAEQTLAAAHAPAC